MVKGFQEMSTKLSNKKFDINYCTMRSNPTLCLVQHAQHRPIISSCLLHYQITGAGHGMGREMALRFARLGAVTVVVDINPAGNEETFKMIKGEKGKVHKYE